MTEGLVGGMPTAAAIASPAPVPMVCTVPAGVVSGQTIEITANGQTLSIQVPVGLEPGGQFQVMVPALSVATVTAVAPTLSTQPVVQASVVANPIAGFQAEYL